MKTFRVVVLLLLASVHVFSPVSSNDETQQPTETPPQSPTTTTQAASTSSISAIAQTEKGGTVATSTAALVSATSATTTTTSVHSDVNMAPEVDQTSNQTSTNETLRPRSFHPETPQNQSDTITNTSVPRGPGDVSQEHGRGASATKVSPDESRENNEIKETGAGPQTGSEKEEKSSSLDKRLGWIALPVLLLVAAAAIVVKFKTKKVHDHTAGTIDFGTENASFQSKPESTRDGVMLLEVKSSGEEEDAAAR